MRTNSGERLDYKSCKVFSSRDNWFLSSHVVLDDFFTRLGLLSIAYIRSVLNTTFSNHWSACLSLIQKLYKWYTSSIRRPLNQDRSLSDLCESAGITEALLAKVSAYSRSRVPPIIGYDFIQYEMIWYGVWRLAETIHTPLLCDHPLASTLSSFSSRLKLFMYYWVWINYNSNIFIVFPLPLPFFPFAYVPYTITIMIFASQSFSDRLYRTYSDCSFLLHFCLCFCFCMTPI